MSLATSPDLRYLGYARYTSLSSAVDPTATSPAAGIVAPAACNYFSMTVLTQDVVATFDDATTTPTATVGVRYPKGQIYFFDNSRTLLATMRLIQQAASAEVVFGWFEGAS